ncbi:PstS ABC-type phosphate transport system, periplasmic component [Burkholderiaceae bacterium]
MLKRSLVKLSAALALGALSFASQAADITGAGATFPYPIFAKWAEVYKKNENVGLNYQSIGSSGGLRQIRAKTVTFGASDAPVAGPQLEKDGMVQFPVILGGVVPIVNIDGFKQAELKLTGPVLGDIFMGTITNWNDPKIAALNPGKTLPNQSITVVHRADGSGTTFIFTDYLNEVSKPWADKVGKGAAVKWPAGSSVGGKGNEGVAANVTRVKGSIGYVEYAYAKKNNITYLQMMNKDGQYVAPNEKSFSAAAAGADWFSVPGMGISLVEQKGAAAWPITGASFVLMYKEPTDKAASKDVIKFFTWAFKDGQQLALDLDYVPLPDGLTKAIASKVWTQIKN